MLLTLQTPGRTLVEKVEVEEVLAPGCKGLLGIFPGHTNFVSELETGTLKWRKTGATEMETAVVTWGFIQIKDEHISVLADVSELAHELDKGRAEVALKNAQEKLAKGGLDLDAFNKHELKLKRAVSRVEA